MKVGIITVHSVPNYGAVLQAYALAHHLRSSGVDAETIDYRQPDLEKIYRLQWRFPPPINAWLRLKRNADFVGYHLPLSLERYGSVEEFQPMVKNYDAFVTGSDQVWFTGPVQFFDRMYFLDFPAPGRRKISYAASAGGTTDFGEFCPKVKDALASFNHISVRDIHTHQLVAPIAPKPPVEVVDPVFLNDFGTLLSERPPVREPYLLVFGDFNSDKLGTALRAIVRATGLRKVVSLQYPCTAAHQRVPSPSPQSWLNHFKHASFVVTSYFHGAAFAAKFERPFVSIPTPGRRIKVSTMLDWMGLQDRYVLNDLDPSICAEISRRPIAWNITRQEISRRVEASKAFLQTALS